MAQTSIHFQGVQGGSEEHNKRLKKLDYVHHELSSQNDYWQSDSQEARLAFVTQNAKAKTGRKMQAKATPIREAVVVISQETTMDDLKNLSKRLNDRFGIDVFQIAIHKDEGYKKSKDGIKLNLHAHLVADWTDHETGKSLKLNRQDMAEMQTICAEVLAMERGKSSDKKHLTAMQFKEQKAKEEAEVAKNRKKLADKFTDVRLDELKRVSSSLQEKRNELADVTNECKEQAKKVENLRSQMQFSKGVVDSRIKRIETLRSEISGLSEQKNEVLELIGQKEQLKKDVLSLECSKQETQMELDVLNGEVFMKEKSRDILLGEVQEIVQERDKARQETAAARASLQELTHNKENVKTWKWAYQELLHIIQPVLDAITRLAHYNGRGGMFTAFETFQINMALGKGDKREERAARYTRWAKEDEERPQLYGDYRYQCAGEEMQKIAKNPSAYLNSIKEGQSRGMGY